MFLTLWEFVKFLGIIILILILFAIILAILEAIYNHIIYNHIKLSIIKRKAIKTLKNEIEKIVVDAIDQKEEDDK